MDESGSMPSSPEANGSASTIAARCFGVRHLQTSARRDRLRQRSGSRIEKADGIKHIDWNAKIAGAGLDQRQQTSLPHGGAQEPQTRRCRLSCAALEHSLRNRRVEIVKIAGALVEVVAVGDPRIGREIVETGVDSGPQDDPICCIQCSLGADCPQLRVSRSETDDGDPGGTSGHALVAALSPPRLRTARNASCGISTLPTSFIRALPSFCFSSSLRLRVTSPP